MFKKRRKKALSHVDWAMSLAIFLLYLAWYFILIKPLIVPPETIGNLVDVLDDGLEDTIFVDTERVYIFVPQSASGSAEFEPVIVDFTQRWNTSRMTHSADYFELDSGRMFFLGNLSDTSRFTVYHPHRSVHTTERRRIVASSTKTTFESFSVYFDGQLLDYARFNGVTALQDFSIEIDDDTFDGDGEFGNFSLMAKYHVESDDVNNTAYTFAENSRVYSFIRPTDFQNHSAVISMVFYNYSYYYFDPVSNGDLDYGLREECAYYDSDFLDLYSADSGVAMTFDTSISFRLCTNYTAVMVDLEFDLDGEHSYNLYFHDGDYQDMVNYPLTPVEGVTETLQTLSRERAQYMRNRDYGYLKQLFGFPDAKDFNITIESDSFTASYGIEQPLAQDVYAHRSESFMIDKDLEQERVSVLMTVW